MVYINHLVTEGGDKVAGDKSISKRVIELLTQGLSSDSEELEIRQPLIRSIESEVGARLVSLNKLSTAELIWMHEKFCK